jgi:hypothetical protein
VANASTAFGNDTIGDWTTGELLRYIQNLIKQDETVNDLGRGASSFTVSRKLTIQDELVLKQTSETVGAAGAASALPATPDMYAKVTGPDGTVRLIPMYKAP